jgi:hypothetical protein
MNKNHRGLAFAVIRVMDLDVIDIGKLRFADDGLGTRAGRDCDQNRKCARNFQACMLSDLKL